MRDQRVLKPVLLTFAGACVVGGAVLGYLTEGGPLWLVIAVAIVLLLITLPLGWVAFDWGDRLGRELKRGPQDRPHDQ